MCPMSTATAPRPCEVATSASASLNRHRTPAASRDIVMVKAGTLSITMTGNGAVLRLPSNTPASQDIGQSMGRLAALVPKSVNSWVDRNDRVANDVHAVPASRMRLVAEYAKRYYETMPAPTSEVGQAMSTIARNFRTHADMLTQKGLIPKERPDAPFITFLAPGLTGKDINAAGEPETRWRAVTKVGLPEAGKGVPFDMSSLPNYPASETALY